MSRTLIDRNSDTGKRSSQTSTCKRCDECLTARRSKLNGGFSRVADPALKAAALAMSRRARAFRRSHTCASKPAPKSRPEVEKDLAEVKAKLGHALVDNLNRNVLKERGSEPKNKPEPSKKG
jgi:hypothetical protein